jgi:hypothetical protein
MNALGTITINAQMITYFKARTEMWKFFGRMNSHLYRQQLFTKMEAKQLSPESMMLVYAMASIIKSQPRIVQAMRDTPENDRFASTGVWFAVMNFFETETVQYVTSAKKTKKFPVVNIPSTMPGLDIFWFCLCTEDKDRTIDNLKVRPTFTQIALQEAAQTVAKEGYAHYWDKIVRGTKNEDRTEMPMMREEYYQTSAADEYQLVRLSANNTLEFVPASAATGKYSLVEVENYLRSFDGSTPPSATAPTASTGTSSPAGASSSRPTPRS